MQHEEQWRDIDGTNGTMQVSDQGRVRSRRGRNGHELPEGQWRICDLTLHDDGYLKVGVRGETCYVHDLVLRAFKGPPAEGEVARHRPDWSPTNNRADNLLWGSQAENNRDTIRDGRGNTQNFTKEEAENVRFLIQNGLTGPEIKVIYPHGSTGMISDIRLGKTWNW